MRKVKKAVRKAAKTREKAAAKKVAQSEYAIIRKQGLDKSAITKVVADNAKLQVVNRCWFCLTERPLCKSHIIPKFHNKVMRNEKGHFNRVAPEKKKKKLVQDQDTFFLFCESCERKFSQVERPYSEWWGCLRLDQRRLEPWMRYCIDNRGNWSKEEGESREPVILLKGVNMHLLKRMHLINIFRLHCSIAVRCNQTESSAANKYRRIVCRFLAPKARTNLDINHLADFSVKAKYVFYPYPSVDCLKPFTVLLAGREIIDYGDDSCCFTGPVLWRIEEKRDDIRKDFLMMKSDDLRSVFPDILEKTLSPG